MLFRSQTRRPRDEAQFLRAPSRLATPTARARNAAAAVPSDGADLSVERAWRSAVRGEPTAVGRRLDATVRPDRTSANARRRARWDAARQARAAVGRRGAGVAALDAGGAAYECGPRRVPVRDARASTTVGARRARESRFGCGIDADTTAHVRATRNSETVGLAGLRNLIHVSGAAIVLRRALVRRKLADGAVRPASRAVVATSDRGASGLAAANASVPPRVVRYARSAAAVGVGAAELAHRPASAHRLANEDSGDAEGRARSTAALLRGRPSARRQWTTVIGACRATATKGSRRKAVRGSRRGDRSARAERGAGLLGTSAPATLEVGRTNVACLDTERRAPTDPSVAGFGATLRARRAWVARGFAARIERRARPASNAVRGAHAAATIGPDSTAAVVGHALLARARACRARKRAALIACRARGPWGFAGIDGSCTLLRGRVAVRRATIETGRAVLTDQAARRSGGSTALGDRIQERVAARVGVRRAVRGQDGRGGIALRIVSRINGLRGIAPAAGENKIGT